MQLHCLRWLDTDAVNGQPAVDFRVLTESQPGLHAGLIRLDTPWKPCSGGWEQLNAEGMPQYIRMGSPGPGPSRQAHL